ncbi:MAG: amidohydrolase [Rhodocyclaceae bacterium]|nr:amidohydrolase [Rhodocyclaceae bacterium]
MKTGRRRFLLGTLAAAALGAGSWSLARSSVVNPCRAALPPELADHPLIREAWSGLDANKVWDVHSHIAGIGDGNTGIEIGPEMTSLFHPVQYAQRLFFMNAGCAHDAPGRVDQSYVERLENLIDGMALGFRILLFAFDRFHDEAGEAHAGRSTFYVPNAYAADLARRHRGRFEWAASIHPYRADAVDALQQAAEQGARAVKWLPAAMGMDPAAPRCDAFYRELARRDLPLIVHCGKEEAVKGGDTQHLGNPLRLRRVLDAGVRVVVAHCASTGEDADLDAPGTSKVASFDLFSRLMAEPRATGRLYADISAVVQRNRPVAVVRRLLERSEWHGRLLNGSDYPVPGILPLISPAAWVRAGLLDAAAAPVLESVREHNPLLFDFALKRSLRLAGRGFPATVFETRPFFEKVPS